MFRRGRRHPRKRTAAPVGWILESCGGRVCQDIRLQYYGPFLSTPLSGAPRQLLIWIAVGIVASDSSLTNTTAATPEDDGNDGQLAQTEEAATEEKVKAFEDQGLFDRRGSVCSVLCADNRWRNVKTPSKLPLSVQQVSAVATPRHAAILND
jgi:hypothetical protein